MDQNLRNKPDFQKGFVPTYSRYIFLPLNYIIFFHVKILYQDPDPHGSALVCLTGSLDSDPDPH
jgi:hypothetical protein